MRVMTRYDQIPAIAQQLVALVVALHSVFGGQLLKACLFPLAAKEPRIAQIFTNAVIKTN